jgi:hypothetical protein
MYLLHRWHHKNHDRFYFIITLITFITIPTILLSASHVHEIGIWARQLDESIVMKLMMSSKKGMRGVIQRENRCGGLYYNRFPTTSSLWHSNGSGKASTRMVFG